MGAITKACLPMNPNGDSQQRQICCVVIAIKRFGKRECLAKKSLSLAEMGGVNFRV